MEVLYREALCDRDAADFDRFADEARGGHAFQTRAWAAVATAGGKLAARFFLAREDRVIGAAVVLRPRLGKLVAPVGRVERGPVCDDPKDLARVLTALAHATRARGVVRLSAMPYWHGDDSRAAERALASARFHPVQQAGGAHATTLRVALAHAPGTDAFAGGEHETLRRQLRRAIGSGAVARRGSQDDIATLARLHAELMARQGMRPKPRPWFEAVASEILPTRGALFVCEHGGTAVSSVLVLRHRELASFVLGATAVEPRPFSKMVLPMCEAIAWARDAGCRELDLGGIPSAGDDDPKRNNIAQFKRGFAKSPVRLVEEHARWL